MRALIAGGVDVLLVETIFDSLNAKAALVAMQEVFDEDQLKLPVMISAAVGRGGETMISAQTVEALWNAVEHVKPISVGLNCSLGPDLMYPFLSELAREVDAPPSPAIRTPGCPTRCRRPASTCEPADMARYLRPVRRRRAWSTSRAAAAATRPSTSRRSPARWPTSRRAT